MIEKVYTKEGLKAEVSYELYSTTVISDLQYYLIEEFNLNVNNSCINHKEPPASHELVAIEYESNTIRDAGIFFQLVEKSTRNVIWCDHLTNQELRSYVRKNKLAKINFL